MLPFIDETNPQASRVHLDSEQIIIFRVIFFSLFMIQNAGKFRNIYLKRCDVLVRTRGFSRCACVPEEDGSALHRRTATRSDRGQAALCVFHARMTSTCVCARSSLTHTRRFPTLLVKASRSWRQDQRAVHVTAHPVRTRTNCNRCH